MIRKVMIIAALAGTVAVVSPASAWGWDGWKGKPGHSSSGGHSTTSGGHSSTSSGGTKVPEPSMLGLFGASLIGLGYARRRAAKRR